MSARAETGLEAERLGGRRRCSHGEPVGADALFPKVIHEIPHASRVRPPPRHEAASSMQPRGFSQPQCKLFSGHTHLLRDGAQNAYCT